MFYYIQNLNKILRNRNGNIWTIAGMGLIAGGAVLMLSTDNLEFEFDDDDDDDDANDLKPLYGAACMMGFHQRNNLCN